MIRPPTALLPFVVSLNQKIELSEHSNLLTNKHSNSTNQHLIEIHLRRLEREAQGCNALVLVPSFLAFLSLPLSNPTSAFTAPRAESQPPKEAPFKLNEIPKDKEVCISRESVCACVCEKESTGFLSLALIPFAHFHFILSSHISTFSS